MLKYFLTGVLHMQEVLQKIKKFIFKTLAYLPSPLPRSYQDFDKLYEKVIWIYDFPNHSSFKEAIARNIMHFSHTTTHKSKYFFSLAVKNEQARTVAFGILQELRSAEKAEKTLSGQA